MYTDTHACMHAYSHVHVYIVTSSVTQFPYIQDKTTLFQNHPVVGEITDHRCLSSLDYTHAQFRLYVIM